MKIGGRKIEGPNFEIVVISRPSGDIEFRAQSVTDFDDFEKLCPPPAVPWTRMPNKEPFENPNDPEYKKAYSEWTTKRFDWLSLESLKATPDLEWERVKPEISDTWKNWRDELKEADFTPMEIGSIQAAILKANMIDEDKVAEARKRFLAGKAAAQS